MTIDVAGQMWTVKEFDASGRGDAAMGRCDSKLGIISIASDLPEPVRYATLTHEWIHGVLDCYGVEHSEAVTNVIANELYRQGFRPPVTWADFRVE